MAPSDSLTVSTGLVQSGSNTGSSNTLQLVPNRTYKLHVDADRDGVVDDDRTGMDGWVWGADGKGAIIPFNNDDDGARRTLLLPTERDFTDNAINANDLEIAPLQIRKHGGDLPATNRFQATLEVPTGYHKFIRIFNGTGSGATEIIGPTAGRRCIIADLSTCNPSKTCGMEALRFPDAAFNGLINIRLQVYSWSADRLLLPDAAPVHDTCIVQVRVAPWMVPHHLDRAERVYVVKVPDDSETENSAFRSRLRTLVEAAGCTLDQTKESGDRWMQDCMEIGYCVTPRATRPHRFTSILRCFRDGDLYEHPPSLAGRDMGWFEPKHPDYTQISTIDTRQTNTMNSGGNIEVTPPVRNSSRKNFPFGRIYYGPGGGSEPFDATVAGFFAAQQVQAPITLDTNWLSVGHVDEMMSFIPRATVPYLPETTTPDPYKRWKLVIASPNMAYRLLDEADDDEIMLKGRELTMKRRVWVPNLVDEPVFGYRQVVVLVDNWVNEPLLFYNTTTNTWGGSNLHSYYGSGGQFDGYRNGIYWIPHQVYNNFTRSNCNNSVRVNRPIQQIQMQWGQTGTQQVDRGAWEIQTFTIEREQTVDEFLTGDTWVSSPASNNYISGATLRRLNEGIWRDKITPTLQKLATEIGLTEGDIVHAPVIFYPTNAGHTQFGALTGDMVNMLVVNGHCIAPYAFGPQKTDDDECRFERYFRTAIEAENLTLGFVNDWYTYHNKHGEVHCGTNTLRLPDPMNDWLESAAARWWEFVP